MRQVVIMLLFLEAGCGCGFALNPALAVPAEPRPAEQVQVTVEDSGVGIAAETIDKIFDSFYTTKPGGMGMGLSICRSIVQAHGGRLWATPKDGAGTLFNFTLPTRQEEESNARVAGV